MTVINLANERNKRHFTTMQTEKDPKRLFPFPMDDVKIGQQGNVPRAQDSISLGGKATLAFKRLAAEFCLADMPETLGQLQAAIYFCSTLQDHAWDGYPTNPSDDALYQESQLQVLRQHLPAFVDSAIAYRAKDTATLAKLNRLLGLEGISQAYWPNGGPIDP